MCSDHFVHGEPTVRHPFPELKLGYEKKMLQPRREKAKHPNQPNKAKKYIAEETVQHHLHLEFHHATTKRDILNFHWNTNTASCQVVKNVKVAFIKIYKNIRKIFIQKYIYTKI